MFRKFQTEGPSQGKRSRQSEFWLSVCAVTGGIVEDTHLQSKEHSLTRLISTLFASFVTRVWLSLLTCYSISSANWLSVDVKRLDIRPIIGENLINALRSAEYIYLSQLRGAVREASRRPPDLIPKYSSEWRVNFAKAKTGGICGVPWQNRGQRLTAKNNGINRKWETFNPVSYTHLTLPTNREV